jgi:hypothetical protein
MGFQGSVVLSKYLIISTKSDSVNRPHMPRSTGPLLLDPGILEHTKQVMRDLKEGLSDILNIESRIIAASRRAPCLKAFTVVVKFRLLFGDHLSIACSWQVK